MKHKRREEAIIIIILGVLYRWRINLPIYYRMNGNFCGPKNYAFCLKKHNFNFYYKNLCTAFRASMYILALEEAYRALF